MSPYNYVRIVDGEPTVPACVACGRDYHAEPIFETPAGGYVDGAEFDAAIDKARERFADVVRPRSANPLIPLAHLNVTGTAYQKAWADFVEWEKANQPILDAERKAQWLASQ